MEEQIVVKDFGELKESLVKGIGEYIKEFGAKFSAGMNAIKESATIYCNALLRHPTTAQEEFEKAYPGVSTRTWETLRDIGSDDLDPRAIAFAFHITDKIKHLPIETQSKLIDEKNKGVLVASRDGGVKCVPLSQLTPSQARIVFDERKGAVRTVKQQKKLYETDHHFKQRIAASKPNPNKHDYLIIGNVVRVGGIEIGRGLLKKILAEMEGTAPAI